MARAKRTAASGVRRQRTDAPRAGRRGASGAGRQARRAIEDGRRTLGSAGRQALASAGRHAPRPRLGRLILLVVLVVGASLYVSPLRAFFAQQDRHEKAAAELRTARLENAALKREAELLTTDAYIACVARSDSLLVPPNTQVFVIKGLPERDDEGLGERAPAATLGSMSVLERVEDLWRTLLH